MEQNSVFPCMTSALVHSTGKPWWYYISLKKKKIVGKPEKTDLFFLLALLPSSLFRHRVPRHWDWENLPRVTFTFRRLLCEKLRAWPSSSSSREQPATIHRPRRPDLACSALPKNPRVPVWIIRPASGPLRPPAQACDEDRGGVCGQESSEPLQ